MITAGSQPQRAIRASYDDQTIVVYQAFSLQIAEAAVQAGTFVPPFSLNRMTWIKPSFFWMMYRCGWARKPGQERVLAISLSRKGFEECLAGACLSHFDPEVYPDAAAWERRRDATEVRVQWDPERSSTLEPLPWRSLQVGLRGSSVRRYVGEWISSIDDITPRVQQIAENPTDTRELLPSERPYPLPDAVAAAIGASRV